MAVITFPRWRYRVVLASAERAKPIMDVCLRVLASLFWTAGIAVICASAYDPTAWVTLLGVGLFSAAASTSVGALVRRHSIQLRRTVYGRWDDEPERKCNVRRIFG